MIVTLKASGITIQLHIIRVGFEVQVCVTASDLGSQYQQSRFVQ